MSDSTLFVTKTTEESLSKDIKKVFLKATNNLSWLRKGDLVLLKPALNSSDPYPATTHPLAIKVVREILENGGAKVIIGDQSGIEHVVHSPKGIVRGSSRELFLKSKMGTEEMSFVGFEELGWEKGFFHFKSDQTRSWKDGFFVTNMIKEVDHIIGLPRLSTHVCAGTTLGLKNMVGLLRQDSRLEYHADGPFSKRINAYSKGSDLKTDYQNENNFLEKTAEISLCLKDKLRLTLCVGTKAQTVFGPDKKIGGIFKTISPKFDEKVIFASSDIVAAEVFAYAFLKYLYDNKTPKFPKKIENFTLFESKVNRIANFSPWENPIIMHAEKIGLGNTKFEVNWGDISEELQEKLELFQ